MNPLDNVPGTIIAGVVIAVLLSLGISGTVESVAALERWIHFLSGVTWIGLLYYFNFIQVPALAQAGAEASNGGPGPAAITKYVAPRALFWFRWGAVVTWLSGAALLHTQGRFGGAFMLSDTAIGIGAWLGTIMLFNVWVLIWPNQKKILGMVSSTPEELAKARRVAFLASRTNTMLSIPMLLFMGASAHFHLL